MYMMYDREGNSPYIRARVYPYKSFKASEIRLSNGTAPSARLACSFGSARPDPVP